MNISVRGFVYKQYMNSEGEQRERVYETMFDIDIDSIESMMPSTGPDEAPEELRYSRITGKSGRLYDIKLTLPELRQKVYNAKNKEHLAKLLVYSQ